MGAGVGVEEVVPCFYSSLAGREKLKLKLHLGLGCGAEGRCVGWANFGTTPEALRSRRR